MERGEVIRGRLGTLGCSEDGHRHGHCWREGSSLEPPAPAGTGGGPPGTRRDRHTPRTACSICPGRQIPPGTTEGKGHELLCPLENNLGAGQEPSGIQLPGI